MLLPICQRHDPQQGQCHEYRRLTKPCVPNKLFDPNNENQKENYNFSSSLLLFVPFRDENDLQKPKETAEQSFIQNYTDDSCLHKHHQSLQQILQAQNKVKEINDAQQSNVNDSVKTEHIDQPYVVGEANAAMNDMQELQAKQC